VCRDETLDSKTRSQKYTAFQNREAIPKATLIVKPEANLGTRPRIISPSETRISLGLSNIKIAYVMVDFVVYAM
jgi:hypothetical protein